MEQTAFILIIILSVVLTLFLIAGITLLVISIRLVRSLQAIAEKAEHVVENVESAAQVLKNAAGPFAAGKFAMNLYETVTKAKKKG